MNNKRVRETGRSKGGARKNGESRGRQAVPLNLTYLVLLTLGDFAVERAESGMSAMVLMGSRCPPIAEIGGDFADCLRWSVVHVPRTAGRAPLPQCAVVVAEERPCDRRGGLF